MGHSTYITVPMKDVQVLGRSTAASSDFGVHDADVLDIRFTLVYEGVNSNGDRFTADELRASYASLVHKRLNWEHDEPTIGVITKAELVEATFDDPLHIVCEAVLWSYNYPDMADIVISAAEMGAMGMPENARVGVSMEALFTDCDYVIGDFERVVPYEEDTNGVLSALRGKTLGGKLVSRLLKNVIFNGAGVVVSPAERKARLLAVASNHRSDGAELFGHLEDSAFALSSLRMFPIDTKEHTEASMAYFNSVASLIEDGASEAQIQEAMSRILCQAKLYGLETGPLSPSTSEGGIENMEDDAKMLEGEETDEVIAEELPAEEAPAEPVEEQVEEGAEEVEAEESEEPATEPAAFDFEAAFRAIMDAVSPREVEATETEVEETAVEEAEAEESEVDTLRARVAELERECASLRSEALVRSRIEELTNAGLEMTDVEIESRTSLLASLSDEAFEAYRDDIAKARKTAKASKEPTDELPLLNLEDEEVPTKRDRFRGMFRTGE